MTPPYRDGAEGFVRVSKEFVEQLHEAHEISKFWVTFRRPNPYDVETDFLIPMQKLAEHSKSDSGKTVLKGKDLAPEQLEKLARSAAATGDDARALLTPVAGAKPVPKSLRHNRAVITEDDVSADGAMAALLDKMRRYYRRIRGNG